MTAHSNANDKKSNLGRRDFLRGTGLAAGAAAGVAATPIVAAAAEVPVETGGYRETDHVRRVYETARF